MFSVTYPEGVRYPEITGRYFKRWCRRYTEQEVGAHICFTAIFQAMERRPQIELPPQFNFDLVWAPWNSRAWLSCKTYVCAHFLFCIPSASSLKIPACCLVRVFHSPLNLAKQQYKAVKPKPLLFLSKVADSIYIRVNMKKREKKYDG